MKMVRISKLLLIIFLIFPTGAFAANYSIGVNAWYVFWDSAIGNVVSDGIGGFIDEEINNYPDPNVQGYNISTDKKIGNGLMLGPAFTFETDDRLWSAAVSGMFSVIITQKMNYPGTVSYDTGGFFGVVNVPLDVTSDIKLSRMEVQVEGRRRFLEYFSAFVGYMYMNYKIDAKFTGSVSGFGVSLPLDQKDAEITSNIHFPLIGLGVEYPLLEEFTVGLDIASGYMFADAEAEFQGSKGDIDIEPKFGLMSSIEGMYRFSDSISVSLGYRFQLLMFSMTSEVDTNGDGVVPDEIETSETFHGITVSCQYHI